MIKDFGKFCVKLFFGRYDEMTWDDAFHTVVLVFISSALLYIFI